jgi:hypothetical protein
MIAEVENRKAHYLTDDIFMVFGGDFQYIAAY